MTYKYEWRTNIYPVSAGVAAEEIQRIEKAQGVVTAENVLDESRSEEATLHDCFEWDDGLAGEKWRLKQSSDLIGNIVRVSIADTDENNEQQVRVRAFLNSEDKYKCGIGTKGAFVSVDTALSDKNIRETVLKNAIRELIAFKNKYATLSELGNVLSAIDDLSAKHRG